MHGTNVTFATVRKVTDSPTGVVMPFLIRVKVKGQILFENDLNVCNLTQIVSEVLYYLLTY